MDSDALPQAVVERLGAGALVRAVDVEPLSGGMGAASGGVDRLHVQFEDGVRTVVRKTLVPLDAGRHAVAARARDHWAWWRREVFAYGSGLLPDGADLRAPQCFHADDDTLYLEDVRGLPEDPVTAVTRLARWQRPVLEVADWLVAGQLQQRLAASSLDWEGVDVEPWVVELWDRREDLLDEYRVLPRVLSHGDFGPGNVLRRGSATVVLDWATLGLAPAGADVALMSLGCGPLDLLTPYLRDSGGDRDVVELGYRIHLLLTGVSRLHWMLDRGVPVPAWYLPLLRENRPPDPRSRW